MSFSAPTATGIAAVSTESSKIAKPADFALAMRLAMAVNQLCELITGEAADPTLPAASEENPQGERGIDLSGAPFGVARPAPLFVFCGSKSTTGLGGFDFDNVHYLDTTDTRNPSLLCWFSKPFAVGLDAPMSKARVFLVVGCTTSANTSFDFEVYAQGVLVGSARITTSTSEGTTDKLIDTGIDLQNRAGFNRYTMRMVLVSGSSSAPKIVGVSVCITRDV